MGITCLYRFESNVQFYRLVLFLFVHQLFYRHPELVSGSHMLFFMIDGMLKPVQYDGKIVDVQPGTVLICKIVHLIQISINK